jgi:hypothetical protein
MAPYLVTSKSVARDAIRPMRKTKRIIILRITLNV